MAAVKRTAIFLTLLWTASGGGTVIYCDLKESCILPCRFQTGDEKVIHWIPQNGGVETSAHSYYYKKNQLTLQDQRFKGRTSLFLDQLSSGNASLLLREVEVQDEGRYKCYTSTTSGHDQSFVELKVDARVRVGSADWTGNRISCSSEGIYPQPEVTWSTEPPSNVTLKENTTVKKTTEQLYNITSSLMLSDSDEGLTFSCNISTGSSWRKVTLRQLSLHDSDHTEIPCATSTLDSSLVWRFNHSQIIVRRTFGDFYNISDQWKQHVKKVSESGSLFLQDLTPHRGGIYTCELHQDGKTRLIQTVLTITKDNSTVNIGGIIVAVVLICLIFITILAYHENKRMCKKHVLHVKKNGSDLMKPESINVESENEPRKWNPLK